MKRLFSLLFVCSCSLQLVAQEINTKKLEAYFDAIEKNDRLMGNVAIVKNGTAVYQRAIGYADVASLQKATTATKYRIGSISKTYTAALIFKAIDEKKIKLNDLLSQYYPAITNANKITLQQLLNHHSGIHNFTDDKDYLEWHKEYRSEAQMLALIIKIGSDFEPGTQAAYSNSNYVLLSYILEKIYKKPYAAILEEKILKPLKLTETQFVNAVTAEKNEAHSYLYTDHWNITTETHSSIPLGAGGIQATPTDILKFATALFEGKIISKKSLEQMQYLQDNYGAGLFMSSFKNHTLYGHTGGIDGFASVFGYDIKTKQGYAITANGVNVNISDIAEVLQNTLYGIDFEIPNFEIKRLDETILNSYTGLYKSSQIPLDIHLFVEDGILKAQATGQPAFILEVIDTTTFKFEPAGIVITFFPEENSMLLNQNGAVYSYLKQQP